VVGVIEAKKEALLEKARAIAAGLLEADRRAAAERFIAAFYEHVPPADVGERGPRHLCGAALSLWRLCGRRRPSPAEVPVYHPHRAADGWSSPHTIVEIVNDDMPFLVDSISLAINADGRIVHLVIHPVFRVTRDQKGRLCEFDTVAAAGLRESWMQIEI